MKTKTKLKKGDHVKYISDRYLDDACNPLWGGTHGRVAGTVENIEHGSIYVVWDNGISNVYSENDLSPIIKDWDD